MTINGRSLKDDQDLVKKFFELSRLKYEKEEKGEDVSGIKADMFNICYYLNFIA